MRAGRVDDELGSSTICGRRVDRVCHRSLRVDIRGFLTCSLQPELRHFRKRFIGSFLCATDKRVAAHASFNQNSSSLIPLIDQNLRRSRWLSVEREHRRDPQGQLRQGVRPSDGISKRHHAAVRTTGHVVSSWISVMFIDELLNQCIQVGDIVRIAYLSSQ